jgi:hypothetical protein
MRGPILAHIIGGGPVWPLWLTGALLFGGAVAAMAVPHALRRICLAVAGVGLVATVAVYVALPSAPPAPTGLSLSIATPVAGAIVTSPVVIRVCAAGSTALPGTGRLLNISVDGRQVAEVDAGTAAVNLDTGMHTVRVELVTSAHRAFAPPVLTDETITVSGIGPLSPPPDCPPAASSTP